MADVIVKADSINVATGQRITTLLLTRFPYTLIQELGTHRQLYAMGVACPVNVFDESISRNSASTRAIPIKRMVEYVAKDPFIPYFTKHQKGMTGDENVTPDFLHQARLTWRQAMNLMVTACHIMANEGVHKQHANDLLKAFLRIPILVTATEWQNFLELRTAQSCRVEFREYAKQIRAALEQSVPVPVAPGEWHVPFGDNIPDSLSSLQRLMVAAARCARLSYASHDGDYDLQSQLALADKLLYDRHLSPFEHIAVAVAESLPEGLNLPKARMHDGTMVNTRNLRGWYSMRAMIEDEKIYSLTQPKQLFKMEVIRKKERSRMNKINLSGHQNPQLEQEGFFFPGALHLKPELLEQQGPEGVAKTVIAWLDENIHLDPDSQVEIAMPGLPLLRDIVMAWVHGKTGSFPITRCPRRLPSGEFIFDPGLDLQSVRNSCRANREGAVLIG